MNSLRPARGRHVRHDTASQSVWAATTDKHSEPIVEGNSVPTAKTTVNMAAVVRAVRDGASPAASSSWYGRIKIPITPARTSTDNAMRSSAWVSQVLMLLTANAATTLANMKQIGRAHV